MAGLNQILEAREKRSRRIDALRSAYGVPLVLLSLNIPGPDKLIPRSAEVLQAGRSALLSALEREQISVCFQDHRAGCIGPEWYASLEAEALRLKQLCVRVEEEHPLGRIFDFDVHQAAGEQLSRTALGWPARGCLLCDRAAHECGRSGRHGLGELLDSIEAMISEYFFNI